MGANPLEEQLLESARTIIQSTNVNNMAAIDYAKHIAPLVHDGIKAIRKLHQSMDGPKTDLADPATYTKDMCNLSTYIACIVLRERGFTVDIIEGRFDPEAQQSLENPRGKPHTIIGLDQNTAVDYTHAQYKTNLQSQPGVTSVNDIVAVYAMQNFGKRFFIPNVFLGKESNYDYAAFLQKRL